jgi:hypothetical protein
MKCQKSRTRRSPRCLSSYCAQDQDEDEDQGGDRGRRHGIVEIKRHQTAIVAHLICLARCEAVGIEVGGAGPAALSK